VVGGRHRGAGHAFDLVEDPPGQAQAHVRALGLEGEVVEALDRLGGDLPEPEGVRDGEVAVALGQEVLRGPGVGLDGTLGEQRHVGGDDRADLPGVADHQQLLDPV
jgi:hypothetical protein